MNNIYIIRTYGNNTSYIKLGYSNAIFKRLDAYFSHNPLVEVIGTTYVEDGLAFEQNLHNKIDSVVRREWYNEDKLDIILSMLSEEGSTLDEGMPVKHIEKKEKKPTYFECANILKNLNKKEALEFVKTIKNKAWQCMFQYGIKTNKILVSYTEARIYYEGADWINQVKNIITNDFQVNKFYTSAYIKTRLQNIYKENGLNRKAKATDLYEFFEIESKTHRVEGITTKGFIILKNKK